MVTPPKREKPDGSQASQKVENHYHININLGGLKDAIKWLFGFFLL